MLCDAAMLNQPNPLTEKADTIEIIANEKTTLTLEFIGYLGPIIKANLS